MRDPDFNNLLAVLDRQRPARPVLFELFMDDDVYARITGKQMSGIDELERTRRIVEAYRLSGYDYATVHASGFDILHHYLKDWYSEEGKDSVSANHEALIFDDASFKAFRWPDPEDFSMQHLTDIAPELPRGMKLNVMGHCGVLEMVTAIFGYENLCMFLFDKPGLVKKVFDAVGERFVEYYRMAARQDAVGVLSANDDWGFNTQTMIRPRDMRTHLFPWHRRIADVIHQAGKPAILHSCGNFSQIMEDFMALGYDGKHSYQDVILPVEEAYECYHDRFAILGGFDVDYLSQASPAQVRERATAMLERSRADGAYALGSGNSVTSYIPQENFDAMREAALAWS